MANDEQLERQLAVIIDPWIACGGDVTDAAAVTNLVSQHPEIGEELKGCLDMLAQLQHSKPDLTLDSAKGVPGNAADLTNSNSTGELPHVTAIAIPGFKIVDESDHVWLADFGLARREVDVTATATGAMLGTPRYMSPEQVSGVDASVDHRTDLYSLATTLYELATGEPVFNETNPVRLLHQIQYEEPRHPRDVDANVPRDFAVVLIKAMDNEPSYRYPDTAAFAAAFADDLRAIRDGGKITTKGLPPAVQLARFTSRHAGPVKIGLSAVAVTCSLLAILWIGLTNYRQSQSGDVMIRVARGPYETTRRRVNQETPNEKKFESESIRITTPMPSPLSAVRRFRRLVENLSRCVEAGFGNDRIGLTRQFAAECDARPSRR